jgi:hypothetical protein
VRKGRTDNPFGSERSVTTQTGIEISTPEGRVRGALHPAENARSALVMMGGGIHGPVNSHEEMATRLHAKVWLHFVWSTASRIIWRTASTTF